MASTLKFNLEEIKKMKSECEEQRANFEKLNKDLPKKLADLKNDWETAAGRKFFEDLETDWTAQVQQYLKTIDAIILLLEKAIVNYSPVEDEANRLSI